MVKDIGVIEQMPVIPVSRDLSGPYLAALQSITDWPTLKKSRICDIIGPLSLSVIESKNRTMVGRNTIKRLTLYHQANESNFI